MDRRQQKTREAIFHAFSELLATKSYTKITVQNIIDMANVGRTTFYAHFETKDHLLRELCTDLFEHVFSKALNVESTHDFSLTESNPHVFITHILYHLRDNKKNILGILNCESGELFLRFFKQYLNEFFTPYMVNNESNYIPYDFLLNHISGSFINMIQWWIKDDLQTTPEKLADYFLAVIPSFFDNIGED